jgi:NADH-quinone oxidoreductase subunit N
MIGVSYKEIFLLALPQTIVVVAGLIALALDIAFLRHKDLRLRFGSEAFVAAAGCAFAAAWIATGQGHGSVLNGMLLSNSLTKVMQFALLLFAVLTILLSIDLKFTKHVGEYILLILLATSGMMFLVASEDILVIFVSLELLSLCLYILTGFNKQNARSGEAALKYFLFGGMSGAFLLFGFSFLYGLSGSTNLLQIAAATQGPLDPLLMVAIVMTVVGFGFKVAAVPFHLWAPDAYEGAPTPAAAFIASSSKVASFFIFAQVMVLGFAGSMGSAAWGARSAGWVPVISIAAAASIVLGNVAALAQTSVKRLLAYSAVAHAGYMLIAIVAHTQTSAAALIYYVLTYALATLGAFGVVAVVEAQTGGEKLADFAGLSRRSPVLAGCMLVFLLSLAGIPPLAGFFAKFYLFSAAITSSTGSLSLLWLVILAIAMSVVSFYYYLQVLKRIYVEHPSSDVGIFQVSMFTQVLLCVIALAVFLLGCAPSLLLRFL